MELHKVRTHHKYPHRTLMSHTLETMQSEDYVTLFYLVEIPLPHTQNTHYKSLSYITIPQWNNTSVQQCLILFMVLCVVVQLLFVLFMVVVCTVHPLCYCSSAFTIYITISCGRSEPIELVCVILVICKQASLA